jgi:hypothetical protein
MNSEARCDQLYNYGSAIPARFGSATLPVLLCTRHQSDPQSRHLRYSILIESLSGLRYDLCRQPVTEDDDHDFARRPARVTRDWWRSGTMGKMECLWEAPSSCATEDD